MMNASSQINLEQFQELRDLLEEDFNDLIKTYMDDSEIRLSELATALKNNDARLGFEASHSLKGASSNLGANHLSELCYQLQEACRNHQLANNAQLVEDITTECRTVNHQITQIINA